MGSWLVGLFPFLATSPSAPNCGQLGGPFGLVWGLEAELQAVPATVNYCIVKFSLTWFTMRSKHSLQQLQVALHSRWFAFSMLLVAFSGDLWLAY